MRFVQCVGLGGFVEVKPLHVGVLLEPRQLALGELPGVGDEQFDGLFIITRFEISLLKLIQILETKTKMYATEGCFIEKEGS